MSGSGIRFLGEHESLSLQCSFDTLFKVRRSYEGANSLSFMRRENDFAFHIAMKERITIIFIISLAIPSETERYTSSLSCLVLRHIQDPVAQWNE